MILYLDLVIISTLIVNYSFIKTIKLIFREKQNIIKMALALLLCVSSIGFFFISNPFVLLLRYGFGIVISLVAFDLKSKKNACLKTALFYLMNFAFIGTLVIFKIYNSWLMIVALLYTIILIIIDSYKKLVIKSNQYVYNVNIKGQDFHLRGFLDTGNQSMYQGIPIVFLDHQYFNESFQYVATAIIETINHQTTVSLYQGGDLIMDNKHYEVYYGFINLKGNEYDLLLNLLLF